jgi:pro-apoptotic serine protease NMA111
MSSAVPTDSPRRRSVARPSAPSDANRATTGVRGVDYPSGSTQDPQSFDPWERVLRRIFKAVVSIKVTVLRSFDTEYAGSFEGTGFVVDRERGIILSNRHIVTQGPIAATAIFQNEEEIIIKQSYTDPVHDFGFFTYDPAKVKFAEVGELELYPQGAKIGLDVKVCGNDGGEKLTVLRATLARIDRETPFYGPGYNDFNINYFQAAAGAVGGSSGSPVLDIQGRAIALNAGSKSDAASGYFLPLEPVVRALDFIRCGQPVPRGTLQTVFVLSSYDELKRLGFPEDAERECRERNKEGTGMLKASDVLPEGPGYTGGLENDDVLVECYENDYGNRFIDSFHSLWEIIDGSVGKEITLTIYRAEQRLDINVHVQDLHSITPNTFIEAGNGIFHPLSYQLALYYHMPCKGIYATEPGVFSDASDGGFLITQLDGQSVTSLEDFKRVYLSLPDHRRVGFRYLLLGGRDEIFAMAEIDHHFYATAQFTRTNLVWKREILPLTALSDAPRPPLRAPTFNIEETGGFRGFEKCTGHGGM